MERVIYIQYVRPSTPRMDTFSLLPRIISCPQTMGAALTTVHMYIDSEKLGINIRTLSKLIAEHSRANDAPTADGRGMGIR